MPSTSAGVSPASSRAALMAWQASDNSVPGRPLAYAVCPMPTMAVWSLIVTSALPPLELGGTALDERHHPLLGILGAADELLGDALVPEGRVTVGVDGSVGEPLGVGDGLGGTGKQKGRPPPPPPPASSSHAPGR